MGDQDQDQPDNAGDHYVSESNYEELLALAQCGSCKWHENYHPDERPRSKKRPKCKDLPASETKKENDPSTNSSEVPAQNVLPNEKTQLNPKENEGANGLKSETPPSTAESENLPITLAPENPPPSSGSENPPLLSGSENPPPISGSENQTPSSESETPPPISEFDNPPPTSESDKPPPTSESETPPPTSESDSPPPLSGSDSPPPLSGSDSPPPLSGSDSPPPLSGSDSPPPLSGSENPPPTSESDNPPPLSGSENPPSTSESETPPPTSESETPPPTAETGNLTEGPNPSLENPPSNSDSPQPENPCDNPTTPEAVEECRKYEENKKESGQIQNEGVLAIEIPDESKPPNTSEHSEITDETTDSLRVNDSSNPENGPQTGDDVGPSNSENRPQTSGESSSKNSSEPNEEPTSQLASTSSTTSKHAQFAANDSSQPAAPKKSQESRGSGLESRSKSKSGVFYSLGINSQPNLQVLEGIKSRSKSMLKISSNHSHAAIHKSKSVNMSNGKLPHSSKSHSLPDARKSTEPVADEEASIPPLGNQSESDSDLIHHHVFDQTEPLAHIDPADSNRSNGEAPPEQSEISPGGIDDRPHSRCSGTDPDKIPDGAPVTDSIYEDLVALGRCAECEWSKNYHPCFEKDGPHVANCDEWNIPFDYYDYVEEPPLEEDLWIDDSDVLFDTDNTNALQYDRNKEADTTNIENGAIEAKNNTNIQNVITEETEGDNTNTQNVVTEEKEGDNPSIQNATTEEKEGDNPSIQNATTEEQEAVNPSIQNATTEEQEGDNTNIENAVTEGENVVAEEKDNAETVISEEDKQEILENVETQEEILTDTPEDAETPTKNAENENAVVADEQGAQDVPNNESPAASEEESNGRASDDKNEEVAPNSEEIERTDAAVINNAGDGPEEMPAVLGERKTSLSEALDEGDNVVMVYVSRSTYEELRARGKLLDKPQK